MTTTTGTTLQTYIEWLINEAESKNYGEAGLHLVIHAGQLVDVRKTSIDHEHFTLAKRAR